MFINVIIFCCIFWGLSFLGSFFYNKKEHLSKKQHYECGFKSLSANKISINLNFTIFAVFLVLYDVDFLLLYPILFNFSLASVDVFIIYILFIFLILLSLVYDYKVNALNWQI